MKSDYKKLGRYIEPVNQLNDEMEVQDLLGISNNKYFQKSHTNTIGIDLSTYRIVRRNQFAFNRATTRNGDKISIALRQGDDCIVSPSYRVFRSKDESLLNSEYLMMWFRRPEFDRYARFKSHGSAHEFFEFDQMLDVELPVPHINKQREIVKEYNAIQNRIALNEQMIKKLEETAQAIYREWFVEGIDRENLPEGWKYEKLEKFTKMKYGKMLDSELFLEKGFPVFSGYGIRGYYSEYMYEDPQILVLCRGVSGTGEVRLSPRFSYITNLSIVVEVKDSAVSKMYLYYHLQNSDLRSLDSGSAQSMITTSDLYFQDAILPPQELQMKFARVANSVLNEIEAKDQENQKLMEFKALLLSRLAAIK
jgi:type I restriction enzyme S subunit